MKLGSLFDESIEWRPIKGYKNEYLVSEAGDVWSLRSRKKLKPATDKLEYTVLYWTHQRSKASITQKRPNVLTGKEKRQEGKRFASFR